MENAIVLKDVTKRYGDFCLEHVNLTIPQGCIVGLVGENGAGKTTVLRAILQMMELDEGKIEILGEERKSDTPAWKEDLGVVLAEVDCFGEMNALQLEKCMNKMYRHWDTEVYHRFLKQFRIDGKKKIRKYSRGTKMKLNLAVALSHHARLLLLDEATSGLDPMVRDEILDLLLEFMQREDHTVILSTHIISDLEKIADYVAFLHEGRLLLFEEKDILLQEYGMLRCTEQEYHKIPSVFVAGVRKNQFGYEVLIRNRWKAQEQCRWMQSERASLEEILVYQIRGGQPENRMGSEYDTKVLWNS